MRRVYPWPRIRSIALVWVFAAALLPVGLVPAGAAAAADHLVVSEIVTGGTSASDELIELYNPAPAALPLEGLEVIYVTASGATISRRASWALGAPSVPSGGHVLVANEAGVYAGVADATYASGMAATGGSVAIRIQGASTAIDAVGWGSAASPWLEGTPAAAPPAGASLERLPGGSLGSGTDTDANAADFVVRETPEPQNLGSAPMPDTSASPTPTASVQPTPTSSAPPTPSPTSSQTPSQTSQPTVTPSPAAISVADARLLADGAVATIHGTALTAWDFADGGGFVADATGGIAVLGDVAYARGDGLLVTGTLDDRFAQRTLRVTAIASAAAVATPAAIDRATGGVNETVEGSLVRIHAVVDGSPSVLSGGLAFDVDDGSGVTRVVVGTTTGIDTAAWVDGAQVTLVGVVGQRDSSGSGVAGYRVQPRDAGDVVAVVPPSPSPSPTPGGSGSPEPSASPSAPPVGVSTIAEARAAAKNERLTVRGTVTLPSAVVDPASAVIQDGTGAMLLRLGDDVGALRLGDLVEVDGIRSTKSGMESLRIASAARRLGSAAQPRALDLRTGEAAEAVEARLVVARGAVTSAPRRASAGSVSFSIDDGSGELRVVLGASLAFDADSVGSGAWVEVTGVLGQETSGSQPTRGYRVWPRASDEVRVVAPAADADTSGAEAIGGDAAARGSGGSGQHAVDGLEVVGQAGLADLRVGATLVLGRWDEAGVAGLLWDGSSLVGIAERSAETLSAAAVASRPPIAVELGHLTSAGTERRLGIPVVVLGPDPGDLVAGKEPVRRPSTRLPGRNGRSSWVTIVGRVIGDRLAIDGATIRITTLCADGADARRGLVQVTGVALPGGGELLVPCDGVRPAPALALATRAQPTEAPVPAARGSLDAASYGAADTTGRRPLAAGLLALGVLVLGGVAVTQRRRPADAPTDSPSGVEDTSDASADAPRLALVPLPHEHRS